MRIKLLKDIAEIIAGQSPPSNTYNKLGEGIPFFQGMADYGEKFPIIRNWCRQPTKISLPNDILISVRAPVGPVNINNVEACIGRGLSAIRAKKNYSSEYIFYFLKANEKQISNLGVGSTFTAITQKDLGKIEISVPETLAEQIKIANVLSRAETLIKQRKENIDLLNEFLKSTFFKMFGDPTHNLRSWSEKKLEEITFKITDGKHGDCVDENSSGYYFLSAKDLVDGKLKYTDVREINEKEFLEVHKRTRLKLNDILLGNTGASIGKIGIVNERDKIERTTFQKSVSIITVDANIISPFYLKSYLEYNRGIFSQTSTGSAMTNLLLSQIRAFNIQVPPLTLQNKFVAIVEKAEALKEELKNGVTDLQNLYGSISQKAFNGKLDLSALDVFVKEEEYQSFTNDRTEAHHFPPLEIVVKKKEEPEDKRYGDPFEVDEATAKKQGRDFYKKWKELHTVAKQHKFYGGGEATISWEWLANRIKERYKNKHFNFEMLMNLVKKDKMEDATNYYSSEEMKANHKLNETEDLKTFIQTAVVNILMDEEQARKANPFLKVKQLFYNAEKENFQLNLHKEDFKFLKNKTAKQRSGIYFNVQQ